MVHKCKQLHCMPNQPRILYSFILRPVTMNLHLSASVHLLFFTKLPATARTRISHITNGRSVSRPLVQSNIWRPKEIPIQLLSITPPTPPLSLSLSLSLSPKCYFIVSNYEKRALSERVIVKNFTIKLQ